MNMFEVFVKHDRIYFSVGNQSFQLAYEPEDEPELSAGQVAEWYMDQLRHALSSLQSSDAQAEIERCDARIAELEQQLSILRPNKLCDSGCMLSCSMEGAAQAAEISRLKAVIRKCKLAISAYLDLPSSPYVEEVTAIMYCQDAITAIKEEGL